MALIYIYIYKDYGNQFDNNKTKKLANNIWSISLSFEYIINLKTVPCIPS